MSDAPITALQQKQAQGWQMLKRLTLSSWLSSATDFRAKFSNGLIPSNRTKPQMTRTSRAGVPIEIATGRTAQQFFEPNNESARAVVTRFHCGRNNLFTAG